MVFLVLAVLIIVTAAATVWLIRARGTSENDPDSTYWYAFGGVCVAAPIILIPAVANNLMSLTLLALALATSAITHKLLARRQCSAAAARQLDRLIEAGRAARHEHDALLRRWSRYELDPAATIDFPAMSDVRVPETSALIKALGAASALRISLNHPTDDGVQRYQRAVTALAGALATAERAAQGCLTS